MLVVRTNYVYHKWNPKSEYSFIHLSYLNQVSVSEIVFNVFATSADALRPRVLAGMHKQVSVDAVCAALSSQHDEAAIRYGPLIYPVCGGPLNTGVVSHFLRTIGKPSRRWSPMV